MAGNQLVSSLFDVNKFIHMVRIVSVGYWNEYLGLVGLIIISSHTHVAFGDQWKSWHRSTLYVLVVLFNIWDFMTWIYIICLVDMFFYLHHFSMDLQCIFGSHDIFVIIYLQCIGRQLWLVWIESITGPMSLSLFTSVSDGELANYFTYHFLLASYFGGHSIAHENITLPS